MLRLLRTVGEWIDNQTGLVSMGHEFMDQPVPDKVGWAQVLGSGAAFLFVVQLATGALMLAYYVPSPDHAHQSVQYMHRLHWGGLVRGVHHFGATAMMIVVGLHLLQVFVWGAYKRPRQMLWVLGLGLFLLVGAFWFTGYLLPWDQRAYWATVTGTDLIGAIPRIGGSVRAALLGGTGLGASTLSRFFAIHVFLLPVLAEVLMVFHFCQVRHHGLTPPWAEVGAPPPSASQRYFPHQVFRACVFALALLGVLMVLGATIGAPLEPLARRSMPVAVVRPPWHMLPMYQVLKYLPGEYGDFIGAFVIPGLGLLALLLLPYLDRNPYRAPHRRPVAMAVMVFVLSAVTALGVQGLRSIPSKTRLSPKGRAGEKLYLELRCNACHAINGIGGSAAPDLALSPRRDEKTLTRVLLEPTTFNPRSIMPVTNLPRAELRSLVVFLQEVDRNYELTRVPSVGPREPASHFEEDWFLAHKFEVRKDPTYCESCHRASFCHTCHQHRVPDSHLKDWLSHHAGVAAENPQYCRACHEAEACHRCHETAGHTDRWGDTHGKAADDNPELCRACHRDRFCAVCHEGR